MRSSLLVLTLAASVGISCRDAQERPVSGQSANPRIENAVDQATLERRVSQSFLALSAFECAVLAPDEREAERLFNIGLKAGREFIAFARANPNYQKAIGSEVAILWSLTAGPTEDFVLGRIYAEREKEMYEDYSTDEQLWKAKKENRYREKNCALLTDR